MDNPWLKDDRPTPKCIYTRTTLPAYIDSAQPPHKRKPFSSLRNLKWAHTLDLILPDDLLEVVEQEINRLDHVRYAKAMLKLHDILSGDFFNEYIKKGNILMLSEGRSGVDNKFFLCDGHLHLSLDLATYERAGLQGQPVHDGGKRHKKNRYAIDIDLRQPSMLHGKKAFERIVWAAKNVLDQTLTWLFFDCSQKFTPNDGTATAKQVPIDAHAPRWFKLDFATSKLSAVRIPPALSSPQSAVPNESVFNDAEFASDLNEWLALVALEAPLLQASTPKPDPYICRYGLPSDDVDSQTQVSELVRLRWQGFLPSKMLLAIFLSTQKSIKTARGGLKRAWGGMQIHGFNGETLSLIVLSGAEGETECLEWSHQTIH